MPELEFEVFCAGCGAGLCNDTKMEGNAAYVTPCQACLDMARQEGYDEGEDLGYANGHSDGITEEHRNVQEDEEAAEI